MAENLDLAYRLRQRLYNAFVVKNYLVQDEALSAFISRLIAETLDIYNKNGNKLFPACEVAVADISDYKSFQSQPTTEEQTWISNMIQGKKFSGDKKEDFERRTKIGELIRDTLIKEATYDHKAFRGWAEKMKSVHITVKADERNQSTIRSTKNPEDGRYVRSYIIEAFSISVAANIMDFAMI